MDERSTGRPGSGGTEGTPTAGGRTDVKNTGLRTPLVIGALCALFLLALIVGLIART